MCLLALTPPLLFSQPSPSHSLLSNSSLAQSLLGLWDWVLVLLIGSKSEPPQPIQHIFCENTLYFFLNKNNLNDKALFYHIFLPLKKSLFLFVFLLSSFLVRSSIYSLSTLSAHSQHSVKFIFYQTESCISVQYNTVKYSTNQMKFILEVCSLLMEFFFYNGETEEAANCSTNTC